MILVFGKTGQVAKQLGLLEGVHCLGRADVDLSEPASCSAAIFEYQPRGVINAAAYTAVDKAEEEERLATVINSEAPTSMARACAELDIPFVHISTDYVFSGAGKRAWQTTDDTSPQNAYGRSKRAGEQGVQASGCTYAILRTSWIISAQGQNFVKSMLKLSETRKFLSVVCDQIGAPTPAVDIADACMKIVYELQNSPYKSGIYHFSGTPDISWYDLANEIFNLVEADVNLTSISTFEFPTAVQRPLNSRLDCHTTAREFLLKRPDWRSALPKILKELGALS